MRRGLVKQTVSLLGLLTQTVSLGTLTFFVAKELDSFAAAGSVLI